MKVLFIDTETGGFSPHKESLLSVGMVRFDLDSGEILDKCEMFVRLDSEEDYVIHPDALNIHGITAEHCMEHGHTLEEITDKLFDMFIGCEVVGGHNLEYDIKFIEHHLLNGESFRSHFGYRVLDSMSAVMLLAGSEFGTGQVLNKAIKSFKIKMSDIRGKFHGALYDAVASARVSHYIRRLLVYGQKQQREGHVSI